jgi:hypothetical protein
VRIHLPHLAARVSPVAPPLAVKVSDDGARAFSNDEGRTAETRSAVHDMAASEFLALCRDGRSDGRRP